MILCVHFSLSCVHNDVSILEEPLIWKVRNKDVLKFKDTKVSGSVGFTTKKIRQGVVKGTKDSRPGAAAKPTSGRAWQLSRAAQEAGNWQDQNSPGWATTNNTRREVRTTGQGQFWYLRVSGISPNLCLLILTSSIQWLADKSCQY